jgi:hypothetical protein
MGVPSTTSSGPTAKATRYAGSGGVGSKTSVRRPSPASTSDAMRALPAATSPRGTVSRTS